MKNTEQANLPGFWQQNCSLGFISLQKLLMFNLQAFENPSSIELAGLWNFSYLSLAPRGNGGVSLREAGLNLDKYLKEGVLVCINVCLWLWLWEILCKSQCSLLNQEKYFRTLLAIECTGVHTHVYYDYDHWYDNNYEDHHQDPTWDDPDIIHCTWLCSLVW